MSEDSDGPEPPLPLLPPPPPLADDELKRLLEMALESTEENSAPDRGTVFGDYELGPMLGRGAQAVVFRAFHAGVHPVVALKRMLDCDSATEGDVRAFRFGAEAAADLDHPNIVPVFHVGECDGRPFFTMRLLEGGNLQEAPPRSASSAAGLVAKVARAVQHAHDRGVIHRDLKPANIVLDEQGEPYVADFGLAKRLVEGAISSKSSAVKGSVDYMAPEQARGRPVTRSDVWSLGAILYELLTGEVPFSAASLAEALQRLVSPEPARPPSALNPDLDAELELVCLKCLEKDLGQRYRSAEELALDLERWLRGERISLAPSGRAARLWRWCLGHPVAATALTGGFLVLVATATVGLSVAHAQQEALRREVLQVNMYAAQATAGQVLLELRDMSDRILRCAAAPLIAARVAMGSSTDMWSEDTDLLLRECGIPSTFDNAWVYDNEGTFLTNFPRKAPRFSRDFSFRNYFSGTKRLGQLGQRGVYVARSLASEGDGEFHMSISAPVFDTQDRWIGLVGTAIATDSALGSLRLRQKGRQMAVLVGLRDRTRTEARTNADLPQEYMVLIHDRLAHGKSIPISGPRLTELARYESAHARERRDQFHYSGPDLAFADDAHEDPVPGFEGRWLAGFSPVGETGYVVIVQTRYDAAVEVPQRAFWRLVGWCGAVFTLGVGVVLFIARLVASRRHVRHS